MDNHSSPLIHSRQHNEMSGVGKVSRIHGADDGMTGPKLVYNVICRYLPHSADSPRALAPTVIKSQAVPSPGT